MPDVRSQIESTYAWMCVYMYLSRLTYTHIIYLSIYLSGCRQCHEQKAQRKAGLHFCSLETIRGTKRNEIEGMEMGNFLILGFRLLMK